MTLRSRGIRFIPDAGQPGADLRRRTVRAGGRRLAAAGSRPPTVSICGTSSCPITTCAAIRRCRSAPSRSTFPITAPPAKCIASVRSRPGASSGPRRRRKGEATPAVSPPPSWCRAATSPRRAVRSSTPRTLFPEAYRGNVFVCDPANNLIHRDVLVRTGPPSRPNAARPTASSWPRRTTGFVRCDLTLGPDGALYVLDFYREVIETPLSLPEDIKKRSTFRAASAAASGACCRRRPGAAPAAAEQGEERGTGIAPG